MNCQKRPYGLFLFANISCLIARRFLVLRELDFCLLPNPLLRFAIYFYLCLKLV